jgi:acetyltransferase-like isoleucine patch superfamily enzyme
MPYYSEDELVEIGFKSVGVNVKISTKASLYDVDQIEIGDHSRIDDFCIVSGVVKIGRNVHITPMCLVAGGEEGIFLSDFVTLAYGVKIFSQSDDYSGGSMVNSTVSKEFKNEKKEKVVVEKHSVVGAGSTIMPGVLLSEGTAIGSMSLILESTAPWSIYVGIPGKRLKSREKDILDIEKKLGVET